MLLVGTLIAIAAERWFHFMKADEESSDDQHPAELSRMRRDEGNVAAN